ncbi:unnamed protein product [Paramecium sonneborni]|uniref:Uncharacterized protein n=1 Tax=Paramecium sonneborni TaxID=65129 RepID=A0A8S1RMT7_9CILI|nr:unnamed protein product [Paramecium sonneborni]
MDFVIIQSYQKMLKKDEYNLQSLSLLISANNHSMIVSYFCAN